MKITDADDQTFSGKQTLTTTYGIVYAHPNADSSAGEVTNTQMGE